MQTKFRKNLRITVYNSEKRGRPTTVKDSGGRSGEKEKSMSVAESPLVLSDAMLLRRGQMATAAGCWL